MNGGLGVITDKTAGIRELSRNHVDREGLLCVQCICTYGKGKKKEYEHKVFLGILNYYYLLCNV